MEERLSIINSIFQQDVDINLLETFKFTENGFCGSIRLDASPKDSLVFDVIIQKNYPFLDYGAKSSKFFCKNVSGILHINEDRSICLVVPKSADLTTRLLIEIEKLKEWRDKYYIRNEKDEKYDYLIVPNQNDTTFLFTDIKTTFVKDDFGIFEAVKWKPSEKGNGYYYITKINNTSCEWSKRIHSQPTIVKGFYYFLGREPIGKGNISFENWTELNRAFNQKFAERLYKLKENKNELLSILIGYNLPNSDEIHWQAILVQTNHIPIKSIRKATNYYEFRFEDCKIQWAKAINISPMRFFGRGATTKKLQESNILVIGCGAIGSSLGKILARGGCKFIDFSDFENIEPGNICRSEYFLTQSGNFKALSLILQLNLISPFIESQFRYIEKDISTEGKRKQKEELNHYDYIFDCSSDDELCIYLDSLDLVSTIINISISNKAQEMVCAIGRSTIWQDVNEIFFELDHSEKILFYEGTGCWSPTFEASYFDINGLLNLAIQNINYRLEKQLDLNTFLVKSVERNGYLNLEIIDY